MTLHPSGLKVEDAPLSKGAVAEGSFDAEIDARQARQAVLARHSGDSISSKPLQIPEDGHPKDDPGSKPLPLPPLLHPSLRLQRSAESTSWRSSSSSVTSGSQNMMASMVEKLDRDATRLDLLVADGETLLAYVVSQGPSGSIASSAPNTKGQIESPTERLDRKDASLDASLADPSDGLTTAPADYPKGWEVAPLSRGQHIASKSWSSNVPKRKKTVADAVERPPNNLMLAATMLIL